MCRRNAQRTMGEDDGGHGDGPPGVGDGRKKHVRVLTRTGEAADHGEVYLRHADDAFYVSPELAFAESETTRYAKEEVLRVEIGQHHSACFVTTATAGDGPTLDALRRFRDDAMGRTAAGRALVRVYYAVSPPVAATLERHPESGTARVVRWLVRRCAALSRRREATDSRAVALSVSLVVTLAYAVGLMVAVGGHAWIRLIETAANMVRVRVGGR